MIPKTIHYCWFGRGPKPALIERCIASWQKYCPDYEIIEWNEDNYDVNCIPFTRDAYADKKWAFVSDYARLDIIYNRGVYLDTDVLLHAPLDELLRYDCWLASDDVRYINTGLGFGAVPKHRVIGAVRDAYNGYSYPSGTNVSRELKVFERELSGWVKSDRTQLTQNGVLIVGMRDYGKWARHLYTYTWAEPDVAGERDKSIREKPTLTRRELIRWRIKCLARSPKLIAYFDAHKGTLRDRLYTFAAYDLLDNGALYFIKRFARKMQGK